MVVAPTAQASALWPVTRRTYMRVSSGKVRRPAKPSFDATGTAVVGRAGQAEIAVECHAQFTQVAGRLAQGRERLEGIGQPSPGGGARHELGDALGSLRADSIGVEAALQPNETREEFDGEPVVGRSPGQGAAEAVGGGTRLGLRRLTLRSGTGDALWPGLGLGACRSHLRQCKTDRCTCRCKP